MRLHPLRHVVHQHEAARSGRGIDRVGGDLDVDQAAVLLAMDPGAGFFKRELRGGGAQVLRTGATISSGGRRSTMVTREEFGFAVPVVHDGGSVDRHELPACPRRISTSGSGCAWNNCSNDGSPVFVMWSSPQDACPDESTKKRLPVLPHRELLVSPSGLIRLLDPIINLQAHRVRTPCAPAPASAERVARSYARAG